MAKVDSKVFVFLDLPDAEDPAMTVKLRDPHAQALSVPVAQPTGYGLGRSGWITVPFRDTTPPLAVLKDWIEESYPPCGSRAASRRTRRASSLR